MTVAISGPYANRLRPCTRQITVPAVHHLIFCRSDALPDAQPTVSKHWRQYIVHFTSHHNRFMALFPGQPGWAGARRELLDFMVQGKINRGKHTNHPAGCHSIPTNQCPPPSSPYSFLQTGCPSCRPTNSVKALYILQHYTIVRFAVRMSSAV